MIHAPSVSFSCTNLQWSKKDGWMWRKKVGGRVLSVTLKTREKGIAATRANALTVRFIQLKSLHLPFEAVRETLKQSRDVMVDQVVLESLTGKFLPINQTTGIQVDESTRQISPEATVIPVANHLLTDVLNEWCKDMASEWKPRTEKLNRRSVDLFIEWASKKKIHALEDVSKVTIADFKVFLEQHYQAPRSRQDALIKLQALFNFAIDKRDYLPTGKNPVKGMTYSKVETVNEKTEITPDAYHQAITSAYVANYQGNLKEMLMILWNTGMRISEAIQLRPEDFREVDGIRCISVNAENGKSLKTGTSERNIPVNSHLNEVYERMRALPQGKSVLGWNKVNAAGSRVANAFKQFGLDHSSHDFRYSLSNRLRDVECPDSVRYSILGHAHKVTTDRVYQTRKPLKQMLNALEKI